MLSWYQFSFAVYRPRARYLSCPVGILCVSLSAMLQGQTTYHVPPDPAPPVLDAGDVLHLGGGGVIPDDFIANSGSVVNLTGGTLGQRFLATGAIVMLDGGSIGTDFTAANGTVVTLNDGTIGAGGSLTPWFTIENGASVIVNGGQVLDEARVHSGAALTINGGDLLRRVSSLSGSQTLVHGGILHEFFNISNNAEVNIFGGSFGTLNTGASADITLHGTDFRFDGAAIAGLVDIGDMQSFALPDQGVLSGTLSDGTPFALFDPDAVYLATALTLKQTAPPVAGPALIQSPDDPVPLGIGAGQTLMVADGGFVRPRFNAGRNSTVIIQGGTVGAGFEAVDASVMIHGGQVASLTALSESAVEMTGGSISGLALYHGATASVHGGTVGGVLLEDGSTGQIDGGKVDSIRAVTGSQVTLRGVDFRINGVPIAGPTIVGETVPFLVPDNEPISAVLADGTPVLFLSAPGLLDPFDPGTLQLQLSDAPPAVSTAPIEAPNDPIPAGLRNGQTLVLHEGAVAPSNFVALEQTGITLNGGSIGHGLKAQGATVTIHDGSIGDSFYAFRGSVVTLHSGTIGNAFRAWEGAEVTVHDGQVGSFDFRAGSAVTIHDGQFGATGTIAGNALIHSGEFGRVSAVGGSVVEINGGNMDLMLGAGADITISGGAFGNRFTAASGSQLLLRGTDFRINGAPVAGLEQVGNTVQLDLGAIDLLSGTLADGTPLALSSIDADQISTGVLTLEASLPPTAGPPRLELPRDDAPLGVREGQSIVVRSGGELPRNFNAGAGSEVRIHGGNVGRNFEATDAAVVITGGMFGPDIDFFGQSTIDVFGTRFQLNGSPIPGLADAGDTIILTQRNRERLQATLLDGSTFTLNLCTTDAFSCRTNENLGGDIVSAETELRLTLLLPGDYDVDGDVDHDDRTIWQNTFGSTTSLAADGNFDGIVDAADYVVWRNRVGSVLPLPPGPRGGGVPEPAGAVIALTFVLLAQLERHHRAICRR